MIRIKNYHVTRISNRQKKSLKAVFLEADFAVNSLSFTSNGVFDNIQKALSKTINKKLLRMIQIDFK